MKALVTVFGVLFAASAALGQASTGKPADPPTQASTPAAAAPAQHQPQAKSKEEFDAYNAAFAKADAAQAEAAADEFAQKFPASELKELLYVRTMTLYQQQNNSGKVILVGRKAIELNPTNPVPLVAVAASLVSDTRDNDLDRDGRYAEAAKDAQAALDNMETGLQVPPGVPPASVEAAKANLRSISYDTLGTIAASKKDYVTAEQDYQKAAELMKDQPDAVVYLRLSVVQDNLQKYPAALDSANKAFQYAPEGSAEKNLAKQQQERLQKLVAGSAPATSAPAAQPH